jgi:hypothetical protein
MRGLFLVLAVHAMQLFIDFGRFGALSAEPPMLWNQLHVGFVGMDCAELEHQMAESKVFVREGRYIEGMLV